MVINLSNEEEKNPYTATLPYIVVLLAIVSLVLLLVAFNKKKSLILLLALVLFIPVVIYALEKISIEIEANVEIEPREETLTYAYQCIERDENDNYIHGVNTITYTAGMTWEEFLASDYYINDNGQYKNQLENAKKYIFSPTGETCIPGNQIADITHNCIWGSSYTTYNKTDKIMPSKEGVYFFDYCK